MWERAALRDLRRLDRQVAERVREAVQRYVATGVGDITRLSSDPPEWRLRVGDWRVRFALSDDGLTVIVLRVRHRREVYRRE